MVDTLLILVAIVSFVIWLVQEKLARPQIQRALNDLIAAGQSLGYDQVQNKTSPEWNELLVKAVFAMWMGWLVSIIVFKDGDFAFVLVILTLLAGLIAGLDKLLFAGARRAFIEAKAVSEFLSQYAEDQKQSLKLHFGGDMLVSESARSFFPVLLMVLVLRSFVVEPFQIPSASMVPTLLVGDYILVNKFAYGLRLPVLGTKVVDVGEPERGDIMVFFPPHKDIYYIKRVIGLPGDTVSYQDKVLYVNGKKVPRELLAELPPINPKLQLVSETLGDVQYETHISLNLFRDGNDFTVTVPPGHYWMMGDNRDNSSDSRVWGTVPEERIVGKAFAIWMHWPKLTQLPDFSRVGKIQ